MFDIGPVLADTITKTAYLVVIATVVCVAIAIGGTFLLGALGMRD